MFGKNAIAGARLASEGFLVNEIFPTLQGEGPFAGTPAIFVRFSGCNLACYFCDTSFETGTHYDPPELIETIRELARKNNCDLIVLTGGEPMLQALHLLIDARELDSYQFQIETAGSYWPAGGLTQKASIASELISMRGRLHVVVSPKTPQIIKELRSGFYYNVYWKYLLAASEPVADDDGLPLMSTQIKGKPAKLFRPINIRQARNRIFAQPMDQQLPATNALNERYAANIAMRYGYRLSLQMHKIVGIP